MPDDLIDRARSAVHDRAELPGMSLMEHLAELRTRLFWAIGWLVLATLAAYAFHTKLINFMQRPLTNIGLRMTMTHPTDALNLAVKTSFVAGAIVASPLVLYQVWLFISPGLYKHEKKYVWPFMSCTIGLFIAGAVFGYFWVLPGALKVLIVDMGKDLGQMITIEDYTGFFLAVILGLGVTFELPVLMFFLAFFGLVDARFFLRHFRYAILAIFIIAAIVCPTPDPIGMTLFATPMLALYFLGVAVAYFVHPNRRDRKAANA